MGTSKMRVLFALAILLTCGFCQEADLEQKNLENNLIDNPSLRYRCPVKGLICARTQGSDGNGFCSFWSFIYETWFLYPAGADKDPMDISGAFSGERGCL